VKIPHESDACLAYVFTCPPTGSGASGGSGADCKPDLTVVRPSLISAPKTLGYWTDVYGRVICADVFFWFCIDVVLCRIVVNCW